jgi:beta-galactosidase/evolved beta-galactosidase subunit alpha
LERQETSIRVQAGDSLVEVDLVRGAIDDWRVNGRRLFARGPRLNLWRAPTDNDVIFAPGWRAAGYDAMLHRVDGVRAEELPTGEVRVTLETRVAPPVHSHGLMVRYEYLFRDADTGWAQIELTTTYEPLGSLYSPLPRIGLDLLAPHGLEQVRWFGRGPGECYVDSKSANRLGVWRQDVGGLHVDYVRPQENGNRTDVRWVAFTDGRGFGFVAHAADPQVMNFSAHHYSRDSLERARHADELERGEWMTVNLDHAQCGLGSGSCGPGPLEGYLLEPKAGSFGLVFTAFSLDSGDPMQIYRSTSSASPSSGDEASAVR